MREHHVIDTPMRPKRWKVESTKFPGRNNSWTEYFEDRQDAHTECDRRNNTWCVVVNMEDKGSFSTFGEAFRALHKIITAGPESIVFPACWIKHDNKLLGFDELREKAYQEGILVGDGELVQ